MVKQVQRGIGPCRPSIISAPQAGANSPQHLDSRVLVRYRASYAACPVAGVAHTQTALIYNILVA